MKILLFGLLFAWTLSAQMMQAVVGATHASAACAPPFTDSFVRADETPLAGNWNITQGSYNLASHIVTINSPGAESVAWYTCTTPFTATQTSSTTAGSTVGSLGPAVRVAPSAITFYECRGFTTTLALYKYVAGEQQQLTSTSYTVVSTDVIKLTVSGTSTVSLACYVTDMGSPKLTFSDTEGTITTGQPGIHGYNSGQITSWTGTN